MPQPTIFSSQIRGVVDQFSLLKANILQQETHNRDDHILFKISKNKTVCYQIYICPIIQIISAVLMMDVTFHTKLKPGLLVSSKRVLRIRATTGPLRDEFHCQRQIRSKSLAMHLQHVSHSDNFNNILCYPQGHFFFFFLAAISPSISSCLFLPL